MNKLSIVHTVFFFVAMALTGCGHPDDMTTTTSGENTQLPKLTAEQVDDVQKFAIEHPEDVSAPPVMPTQTEAGARGIYLRYTPYQVGRIYDWAQTLSANCDPRAGRVNAWFNHIVSVKCSRFPNGPVCQTYGG